VLFQYTTKKKYVQQILYMYTIYFLKKMYTKMRCEIGCILRFVFYTKIKMDTNY